MDLQMLGRDGKGDCRGRICRGKLTQALLKREVSWESEEQARGLTDNLALSGNGRGQTGSCRVLSVDKGLVSRGRTEEVG